MNRIPFSGVHVLAVANDFIASVDLTEQPVVVLGDAAKAVRGRFYTSSISLGVCSETLSKLITQGLVKVSEGKVTWGDANLVGLTDLKDYPNGLTVQ